MDQDEALQLLQGGEKGIKEWNRRRQKGEEIPILNWIRLYHTDFYGADLSDSDLHSSYLFHANLSGVNLCNALVSNAGLLVANLSGANLRGANLTLSNLTLANLSDANLSGAVLTGTVLSRAKLNKTNFEEAHCSDTLFQYVDLSVASGLGHAKHGGPSGISTSTLVLSKGRIPVEFLKGCGLADWEIEATKLYQPGLSNSDVTDIQQRVFDLRSQGALQVNSLFISYSHANTDFVETIEKRLDEKHIRFWRDVHDMKAGRLEKQIDRGMRLNPTVLLVFSKDSVESDWVEWEVSQARKLEKKLKRDVLCPVALDDSWKTCDWPGPLRQQIMDYNILDFSAWQERDRFDQQFEKLVKGLDLFYRPVKS